MATDTIDPTTIDPTTINPTTIDPTRAVESYVDATGGGGEAAGFPWPLAIGFVLVLIAVFVLTIVVRRRLR